MVRTVTTKKRNPRVGKGGVVGVKIGPSSLGNDLLELANQSQGP